jgi:GxxExxY protein
MEHKEITHAIIGCAMRVHRTLGTGFQEVIYQRALAIEMEMADISFGREVELPIFYRDIEIGSRRVDFFVAETIIVELKAVAQLEKVHLAQVKNYLTVYKASVGLLINFGNTSLEFKRAFANPA